MAFVDPRDGVAPGCSFSGDVAGACWFGEQHVGVCRDCAVEVLANLAADASVGERGASPSPAVQADLRRRLAAAARNLEGAVDNLRQWSERRRQLAERN